MEKYQGEHINFSFNFIPGERLDLLKFSDFDDVLVVLKTDACFELKFSMNEKEGFQPLALSNTDLTLTGIALPEYTLNFAPGSLTYELKCVKGDDYSPEKTGKTGIRILPFTKSI